MIAYLRYGLILALLFLLSLVMQAEEYAALLEVRQGQVAIQRVDTEQWITLRQGSIAPVGTGDTIRTDETGRALIDFSAGTLVLLLSNTSYQIATYTIVEGQTQLHGSVEGIIVQELGENVDFRLQSRQVNITRAAGSFGLWSSENSNDVLAVSSGSLDLEANGTSHTLSPNEMYRYQTTSPDLLTMEAPLNEARLIGILDGCPAIVRTVSEFRGVLVRTSAGQGYQRRGLIQDFSEAKLLARTESGYWTRVQYGNGFGWIISIAVLNGGDCDLPLLPDDAPEEYVLRVLNANERELEILRPFYGRVDLDGWFYQFTQ